MTDGNYRLCKDDDEFNRLADIILPRAKEVKFNITKSEFAWLISEIERWKMEVDR
jgi:hypothetical protein